jgi:hypothetical protein
VPTSAPADTHPVSPPRHKLITLEAGRFVAAASVMLGHYTGVVENFRGEAVFGNLFGTFHIGVPYFYVLSGFIIYHVHRRDIGRPQTISNFVRRRAVRLLPMFWAISAVMLAGFLLSPSLAQERNLTGGGVVADLLLLPHANAILAISWTLRHETFFYFLFALALWLGPRALWLVAAWIVASVIASPWNMPEELGRLSIVASVLNVGFGLGIGIAILYGSSRRPDHRLCAGAGAAVIAVMLVLEWLFNRDSGRSGAGFGDVGTLVYLIASAALIYGLVVAEERWRMPLPRFWQALGGSSYVLYLIHQPIASLAFRAVKPLSSVPPGVAFVLLAALAIGAALVIHLLVERRVISWLSARIPSRRSAES